MGTTTCKDDSLTDHTHISESPSPESPTLTFSIDYEQNQPQSVWSCSPLSDLCFGPSAYPILSHLKSSLAHCVTITLAKKPGSLPIPVPPVFKDVWDSNHVRMPCSSQCLYPVGSHGSSKLEKKWHLITQALKKPMISSFDLEEAILSYNSRFASKWQFRALHCYFTEYVDVNESKTFFQNVLPKMVDLALSLPQVVTHAIPLLHKQQSYSVTLSQQQIACLLANAFFCTFPRRNTTGPHSEYSNYPTINFNTLFCAAPIDNRKMNKLHCLLHYFRRVVSAMPTGTLTFTRQVCSQPPDWVQCHHLFSKLHVTSQGTIEDDGSGMLQVDFANMYIGGGVLGQGCVQEEIRFLICPELIVSRLFTEELDANESLLMIGAEQYSQYKGYAATFKWDGDHIDDTLCDDWQRKQVHIVAIDALVFRGKGIQYHPSNMSRELNKAYCGFMGEGTSTPCGQLMAVATGNWGCGAFGGEPHLKALLQWMAASVAKRDVVYFTFDKQELQEELNTLHNLILSNKVTVSQMWTMLNQYHLDIVKAKKRTTLLQYITAKLT